MHKQRLLMLLPKGTFCVCIFLFIHGLGEAPRPSLKDIPLPIQTPFKKILPANYVQKYHHSSQPAILIQGSNNLTVVVEMSSQYGLFALATYSPIVSKITVVFFSTVLVCLSCVVYRKPQGCPIVSFTYTYGACP